MKHLPGNPFEPSAAEIPIPEDTQDFATLALAYEQRTANLIALLPQMPQIEVRVDLVNQIMERLDLRSESQS